MNNATARLIWELGVLRSWAKIFIYQLSSTKAVWREVLPPGEYEFDLSLPVRGRLDVPVVRS
jgi:hypothetical protein